MPFVSDNFTAANGTLLSTHNAAWVQNTAWELGAVGIESNRVAVLDFGNNVFSYNSTPASANYEVTADLFPQDTSTVYNAGLMARMDASTATGYMCRYRRGTGVQLFKFTGSTTATQLGSSVAGDVSVGSSVNLRLRCDGSTIKVFKDGTEIISVTDTGITAAGRAGLWINGAGAATGVHLDAWSASYLLPLINTQPSNASVTAPATANFTVSATVSAGSLSYQWQVSTDSGATWGNVSDGTGATTASYTTSATAVSSGNHRNGYRYRCAVTDSNGTVNSNSATLTVSASTLSVTLDALVDETGAARASYLVDKVIAVRLSDNTVVAVKTAQTTNGSGVLPAFSDAALTAAPHIFVTWDDNETPNNAGAKVYTPS